MPVLNQANLIGKVFTMESGKWGESWQAHIVKIIEDYQDDMDHNIVHVKFKYSVGNDIYEKLIAYNDL